MDKIYLVVRSGWEWCDPIHAFADHQRAKEFSKKCGTNESPIKPDPRDHISTFEVVPVTFTK